MTPQKLTAAYQPRPQDADAPLFGARVTKCFKCPLRNFHECKPAGQLISVLARPKAATCPNRQWPGELPTAEGASRQASGLVRKSTDWLAVAIVIISHNYGRFLAEAIESVLAQTYQPAEVLVVDDASEDETAQVAACYAERGVRYIRIENRAVTLARLAGFQETTSPIVLFLDADDVLCPDYLSRGVPLFADQRVGIVYSDCEKFGSESGRVTFPMPAGQDMLQQNYAYAGSLIRRAALECSEAFAAPEEVTRKNQDDWYLWRRIVAAGWTLAKSPAIYRYRRHEASHTTELIAKKMSYFDLASLAHETITLFIPLAGRVKLWDQMRDFLERQLWPHDKTSLVLCDTSQDPRFAAMVRNWLSECDYSDARYYAHQVGLPGLADENRRAADVRTQVQRAMPRIYNRLAREATTEYVWIVEDDVLPPLDAAQRLLEGFDDDVASVSGAYRSRFQDTYVAWDIDGQLYSTRRAGILPVGGNGFGCVVVRRSIMQRAPFTNAGPTNDYDPNFYRMVARTKTRRGAKNFKAMLNWNVMCQHGSNFNEPMPSSGAITL
ncbi:MAG: glycosyltransferase [Planctomycetaceae bacterium]|nr:glycosyltransferase [Planctomycetaceae bacterium]